MRENFFEIISKTNKHFYGLTYAEISMDEWNVQWKWWHVAYQLRQYISSKFENTLLCNLKKSKNKIIQKGSIVITHMFFSVCVLHTCLRLLPSAIAFTNIIDFFFLLYATINFDFQILYNCACNPLGPQIGFNKSDNTWSY